jgi:ATP-dependent metalloprotease
MATEADKGSSSSSDGGQPTQEQPTDDATTTTTAAAASARALEALERLTPPSPAAAPAAAAVRAAIDPLSDPQSDQQQQQQQQQQQSQQQQPQPPQQLPEGVVAFLAAVAAAVARVQGAWARLAAAFAALRLWVERQLDRVPAWAAARRLERAREAADAAPADVAAQVALLRLLNERARRGAKAQPSSAAAAAAPSAATAEEVVQRVESRRFARDAPAVVVEYVKALVLTGRLDRFAAAEEAAAALAEGAAAGATAPAAGTTPFEAAAQLRLLADALPGPGEDHRSLSELLRELQVQAAGGEAAAAAAEAAAAATGTAAPGGGAKALLEPGSSLLRPLHVVVQAPGGGFFPAGAAAGRGGSKAAAGAYLYAPAAARAGGAAPATVWQALWRLASTALLLVGLSAAWLAGNQVIRRASIASVLQQQALQQQQQLGGANPFGANPGAAAAAAASAANAANAANAAGGSPATEPKEYRREDVGEASAKTFRDVLGCDEAKAELEEVVEFLRNPERFTRLGAKLPKGVLLTGPPGTGKTLLAKAVAGEAGVPFFFRAGSEFEELYVGVGSRRMRALFAAAKKKAPCIVFIDEIDAIGGNRKHWENHARKTLNQLLVEMDGFEASEGVIVLAATNLPDTLDPALKRPGRFDRQVAVPLPDVQGRESVLAHYLADKPVATDVDARAIARQTPGFSGADLANLVNEAALLAAKNGDDCLTAKGLDAAHDKVVMGLARRSAVRAPEALKRTAYHEGGHALVATHTPGATRVHKATIVPRGHALGMVTQVGRDDEFSITRAQMMARVRVCLGGTVAEELIFGRDHVSSGATDDLRQATEWARHMIAQCGMSDAVGPVYIPEGGGGGPGAPGGGGGVSEATRQAVDAEVRRVLTEAREGVKRLLSERLPELHAVAGALLDRETLTADDLDAVIRGEQLPPLPPVVPPPGAGGGGGGGGGGAGGGSGGDGKKSGAAGKAPAPAAIEQQAAG